jgi:hypothetical protein
MPLLGGKVVRTDTDLEAISVVSDHFLSQWQVVTGGTDLEAFGVISDHLVSGGGCLTA